MAALDAYQQPQDVTTSLRQAAYGRQMDEVNDAAQMRALQLGQAQNQANRTQESQTAGGDVSQWTTDPNYKGKAWGQLPTEATQHFQNAYPDIQSEIPGMFNKSAAETAAPVLPTKFQHVTNPTTGQMGAFNPITGEYKSIETPIPGEDSNFTTPASNDATIQGFISRSLPLSALPRSGPMRMAMIEKIREQDPTWTPQDYDAQNKARESFVGQGVNAKNIVSLNTMLEHLGQVRDTVDGMNNSGVPAANRVSNYLAQQFGTAGNQPIQKFNTAADTAATEYARALTGGAPSLAQIQEARAMLDQNQTPDVLKGNIQQMAKMAAGRISALQDEWNNTVKGKRDIPFITGNSPARLKQFGIDPGAIEGGATTQAGAPAANQPPDLAITHLKQHPELAGQFDAKYGQGTSAQYLGK